MQRKAPERMLEEIVAQFAREQPLSPRFLNVRRPRTCVPPLKKAPSDLFSAKFRAFHVQAFFFQNMPHLSHPSLSISKSLKHIVRVAQFHWKQQCSYLLVNCSHLFLYSAIGILIRVMLKRNTAQRTSTELCGP